MAKGTFTEATVVRGPDWKWGDQDGKVSVLAGLLFYSLNSALGRMDCIFYGILCCSGLTAC
jgi:hypothetical protein